MRGRELEHVDRGFDRLRQAVEDLAGVGRPDDELKRAGRFIIVNLSPLPRNQRVLKFNTHEEAEVEEDDYEDHEEDLDETDLEEEELEHADQVDSSD